VDADKNNRKKNWLRLERYFVKQKGKKNRKEKKRQKKKRKEKKTPKLKNIPESGIFVVIWLTW